MVNRWLRRGSVAAVIWAFAVSVAFAEPSRPITIFAAASLGDVLRAATADAPAKVRISVGGSGAIARQIDQGAPADVVMLANTDWMDWLTARNAVLPDTRTDKIGNQLVVVGPPGAVPLDRFDRDSVLGRLGPGGRIAIGEHRSVPAGIYARLWLDAQNLWELLRPRLAETDNVRAALALVSRGEVPLAVIYASDLHAAPDSASAVWIIPRDAQPDIRYSLAAVTPAGRKIVDHLTRPSALDVFADYGFVTEAP